MQYIIGSRELTPQDSDLIAVLDIAIGIDAAKLNPITGDYAGNPAVYAWITIEGVSVRFKIDGSDPITLVDGHLLGAGDTLELFGIDALSNFRMVREDGSESPIAQVSIFWPGRRIQ